MYYPPNYVLLQQCLCWVMIGDCACNVVINISVQYNGGFLSDIILLTQDYTTIEEAG